MTADTDFGGLDSITLELIRNSLIAASNEMALVVQKTGYSPTITEGRDFSGTIYDASGNLVSQGEFDLPTFTGLTLTTVPHVVASIGMGNISPGDIYMVNDPYEAATHTNDIFLVKPIFFGGERIAFVCSAAHWSDVGGAAPGSMNPRARSFYEEGIRIPPIAIYKDGILDERLLGMLMSNMRESKQNRGDFNAQISAISAGEKRVLAIAATCGREVFGAALGAIQDYSERLMRAVLRELDDGVYEVEDTVDSDVFSGESRTIRLKLTISGDEAVFDFTKTDGVTESGINCTLPTTRSALFTGIAGILPKMPTNAGMMRPVKLQVTPGSLLAAQPPVPVSAMAPTTMECVIAATMLALSKAYPVRAAGASHAIVNSVFAGRDPRPTFGGTFISYVFGFGGMGATQSHDGTNCTGSAMASSTSNIPCELQERRFPVLYLRSEMLADSGGPGKHRGGLAQQTMVSFPDSDVTISAMGIREQSGPPGIFGGRAGGLARVQLFGPDDAKLHEGIMLANEPLPQGGAMVVNSSGGGGYGDRFLRDPQAVLDDVIDGYVSLEGAARDYGVAVKELDARALKYVVDEQETALLRSVRSSDEESRS